MGKGKGKKTAVFGGAFDPPHNAHIEIAEAAIEEYGYEKVIFLPSYNPPHKKLSGSADDRLNMLRLAARGRENFGISTYELDSGRIGYTVETLPALKKIYGDFDFVIGGDSMADMKKWYRPEQILAENDIVVAVRDGERAAVLAAIKSFGGAAEGVEIMAHTPESVSSSEVRLLVRLGEEISRLVPEKVSEYIAAHGLYDDCKAARNKLKADLTAERYSHTLSVVKAACALNKALGLDPDKVFFAALLHDCAKSETVRVSDYPIPIDAASSPVGHAFAGAYRAREYGIDDPEILNAIYYHTTGRAEMTVLEKLIYTADMIEDGRDFEGVGRLRELCKSDFESGFKACLAATYRHLKERGGDIYYLTEEAYEYYCTDGENYDGK